MLLDLLGDLKGVDEVFGGDCAGMGRALAAAARPFLERGLAGEVERPREGLLPRVDPRVLAIVLLLGLNTHCRAFPTY